MKRNQVDFLHKGTYDTFMADKYFYKREKVANLLFDLVKYLLTALGATLLFTDKEISIGIILIIWPMYRTKIHSLDFLVL